ncbi:MAG TPA: tetratricopeptide repeat protein, partial [Fibrobacteria bacterium]|nr:tetratricopeptide repeat protein [Fibrobacteria bacterium]
PQATLRVGALLASQGKPTDAATLYQQALEALPHGNAERKSLIVRLAETREAMGQKVEAAQAWTDAWTADPADTTTRNRAIAHLEGAGAAGEAPLRALLEKALDLDAASAPLHFKLAVILLRAQDRKAAYSHLESALKASPGNPTYQARLPEAIEGDSLIQVNFPILKAKYEKEGASLQLALQVARGYSLAGDKAKACGAWGQIYALSPRQLDGRRDAFRDLAACGDPASLMIAAIIGGKHLNAGFDRETSRAMVQIAMRLKDFPKAAALAGQMVIESPQDAPMALSAAKAMLDAGRNEEAKAVLTVIGKHAPLPEAGLLLGRMYYADKDCPHAAEQFAIARDSFPEALRLRGDCLAELKDFQSAAAEYETHYARSGDRESLRAVARMYRASHFGPKEAEVLETLAAKGWAGDEERLRMADLKAAQGDARAALVLYDELLSSRSSLPAGDDWSEAAILLGTQQARDGKLDKAIHVLTLGLKSPPASLNAQSRAEAWSRLGECLVEKRMWKEALPAYAAALAADSLSGEAAVELLMVSRKLDAKKEMGEAFRAVYRLDPANEEANAYLAGVRQAAREYKEAAAHYRRIAQYHPKDAKAWENLGNALAMIPDLSAASGPLQTAIDLGAQSDEVYINRARAYRLEGSKDMAASILEFLLNRNPHDYLAVLWSAKFAEEDGNQHIALELFKKSAKLSAPRSPWPELVSQGMLEAKVSVSSD